MNKQERKLRGLTKFKKRLANLNLINEVGNFHAFKSHGKPCSCYVCSTHKFKHNGVRKKELQELNFALSQ